MCRIRAGGKETDCHAGKIGFAFFLVLWVETEGEEVQKAAAKQIKVKKVECKMKQETDGWNKIAERLQ